MSNSSIWPIDGYDEVLCIHQNSKTRASPSNCILVISRTHVGGMLSLYRDAVGVFYRPADWATFYLNYCHFTLSLSLFFSLSFFLSLSLSLSLSLCIYINVYSEIDKYIYIYIYIYIYMKNKCSETIYSDWEYMRGFIYFSRSASIYVY